MRALILRALGAAALLGPPAALAQASAYVPTDDIAYTYINALTSRGFLRSLSSLERPYTVSRVRASMDTARTANPGHLISSYLDALSHAISKYELRGPDDAAKSPRVFRTKASFHFFGTAQSSARRELMLADAQREFDPGVAGYFVFGGGRLAGSVRAILDNRLNSDPDFAGRKDRNLAGRTEDGYLGGQWKFAEVAFGRVARSWGPAAISGLQLGDEAYTYDHLYGRFGPDRFHVSAVVARLENYVLSPGVESSRYFSIHRLSMRRGRFEGALSEAFVYTGVGRGLEPSLINPLNVFSLSWRNERADGNLNFGAEAAYRGGRFGTFSAQLLVDDIQIDKCDTVCNEPSSYGVTLTAEGMPLVGDQRLFASYTRVSNLAYRTPNVAERYASYLVGLGRGYSGYDEVRIGVDLALIPRTPLRLYVAHRRQGEGDYRKPYPQPSEFGRTPGFLSGTVWTTSRVGLSGSSIITRDLQVTGDGGINRSTNRRHLEGYDTNFFEGRVRLAVTPRWRIRFD